MKKDLKKYILLLLFITILFNTPIFASQTELTFSQKAELQRYTHDLTLVQKYIYTLAQSIVFSNSDDISATQNKVSRINKGVDTITQQINTSLASASLDTPYYRDLLLLANAVNYIKSSLYELNLLSIQEASSEKMTTLERYFNFRVYANNSLRFFDSLQPPN